MSVSTTGTLVHLPFADRAAYGSPYPEGLAVEQMTVTGDATGGIVTTALQADGGFLYRLEMLSATKGSLVSNEASYILAHRMLTDRSGGALGSFNRNWVPDRRPGTSFSTYNPAPSDLAMLRRLPAGRTDRVSLQVLANFNWLTNEDTIVYDVAWIFTYWPVESLYRPGFLASFWESPFVPTFA